MFKRTLPSPANTRGRRLGTERRCFFYSLCIPERREGRDRRRGVERRRPGRLALFKAARALAV